MDSSRHGRVHHSPHLSRRIKAALEREVVGQPRAVNSLVRAITRTLGGFAEERGPLGVYLFMGPSGTGKTHIVRSLAQLLGFNGERLAVADCTQASTVEDWSRQMAPLFRHQDEASPTAPPTPDNISILLIERLERGRPEMVRALMAAIETGYLLLPDGQRGCLSRCLVILTSNLCSKEILEAGHRGIGFSHSHEDEEESENARIFQICHSAAERQWDRDLLGRFDDIVIFHRLSEDHLPLILDRQLAILNRRLAHRGWRCETSEEAREFLLERGGRDLRQGARPLIRAFRRFLEYPVADLAASGRLEYGEIVHAFGAGPDGLRFAIPESVDLGAPSADRRGTGSDVAVEWLDDDQCIPVS